MDATPEPSMDVRFLSRVNQIIEDNLSNENFTVDELSSEAGLSRSNLHRKLVKLTGKSASDLIQEARLRRARQLLENDVATVSEVAYRVGFNSPSYFNKVFQKFYGVSPGEVRKGFKINPLDSTDNSKISPTLSGFKSRSPGLWITVIIISLTAVGIYVYLTRPALKEKSIAVLPLDNLT